LIKTELKKRQKAARPFDRLVRHIEKIMKWIAITEEKPPCGEAVLVNMKYWVSHDGEFLGEWCQHVYITSIDTDLVDSKITHWMPKPKPPILVD
jgi:hypothetical protein